jgi:hypothetical protein
MKKYAQRFVILVVGVMWVLTAPIVLVLNALQALRYAGLLHGFVSDFRALRWQWEHCGWTPAEIDAEELARIRSRFPGARIVVE